MGALPKKKLTRARKGRRLSSPAYRLRAMSPARCPRCGQAKLPHAACPACGYYRGRSVAV
ncbi:MAG: 50S ribosomal protein L32 [Chloroflexota bacterium]|nr:50S ribosomal protein L32 [Chloroflexota bacterium]MDE2683447.1 50S ribosomal protein L32 [Chloroflexota bacterium]